MGRRWDDHEESGTPFMDVLMFLIVTAIIIYWIVTPNF